MYDIEREPAVGSGVESTRFPRYATFVAGDGETVLYDTDQPTAWLQSSRSVDLEEVR